ncbi:MAG: hypothetical protein SGPRY_013674, partial [Prymnesium sp.]
VAGLRKAFSTLSDVLIEEVDLIRSELGDHREEQRVRAEALSKSLKGARGEINGLSSESARAKTTSTARLREIEEKVELLQEDMTVLAQASRALTRGEFPFSSTRATSSRIPPLYSLRVITR